MDTSNLSGLAARLFVALLFAGEESSLVEVARRAGIPRLRSAREATHELHKAGMVEIARGRSGALLLSSPLRIASGSAQWRGAVEGAEAVAGATVEGKDKDKDLSLGNSLSLNLSRYPSFSGGSYARNRHIWSESDTSGSGHVSESDLRRVTESDTSVVDRTESDTSVAGGRTESDTSAPEVSKSDLRHTPESDTSAELDSAWEAIEAADSLVSGPVSHQKTSPYVLRRKAQVAALLAFWRGALPGKPVTAESLTRLLQEADNSAALVAEMIEQTHDRIEAGTTIQSPWGYIRAAIKNRQSEPKKTTAAPLPTSGDGGEMAEMTPEFQAELDALKVTAAKYHLWG